MHLCSWKLVALLNIAVMLLGEQGLLVAGGEIGSEFEPLNTTLQKGD
jgi:hypothetical protein